MKPRTLPAMLTLLASCASPSTSSAAPAPEPSAPSAGATTTPGNAANTHAAPVGSAASNVVSHADVLVLPAKTDFGSEVLGIGQPRMRLADDDALGRLALRSHANLALAEDARWVTIWSLVSGAVIQRIAPLPELDPLPTTFAISPDAGWIAVASGGKTRVFMRPFDQVAFTSSCSTARASSHDSKLLACHGLVPEVWDVAAHKLAASPPGFGSPKHRPIGLQFSTDDRSLYWATNQDIVRWDFATSGALTTIYKSRDKISNVVFSEGSNTAFISTIASGASKHVSALVDLDTGQTSAPAGVFTAAVSASGKRLMYAGYDSVRVVDAAAGDVVWSTASPAIPQRVAFANDADLVGFVEGKRLHVVDLASGPRKYEAPSRFAGWLEEGVAAIDRNGTLEQLALADRTWSSADRGRLTIKTGAPAWASWAAPGGTVAAERSPRHETPPDARSTAPCAPKLRVWTPKGGAKTVAMTCAGPESEDPGWDIGGGWVVGVGTKSVVVYDATSGKRTGAVSVERPRIDKPKFARAFTDMALSPAGNFLALVSRGPELPPEGNPDPREDALHIAESQDKVDCVLALSGECRPEYFLALYKLDGAPKQAWRARLEEQQGPDAYAAQPTAIAFDHAGAHVLVGMSDGEIQVMSTSSPDAPHVERFHHGPITKLVVSPGDAWVFSEDSAGQQRIWRLPQ